MNPYHIDEATHFLAFMRDHSLQSHLPRREPTFWSRAARGTNSTLDITMTNTPRASNQVPSLCGQLWVRSSWNILLVECVSKTPRRSSPQEDVRAHRLGGSRKGNTRDAAATSTDRNHTPTGAISRTLDQHDNQLSSASSRQSSRREGASVTGSKADSLPITREAFS
jgi:hypothetical protein